MYAGGYYVIGEELRRRLAEPAPGRVQLLTGARQVGKTTLMLELAREWGGRAVYVAADLPEAALPGWWEAQWQRARQLGGTGTALLLVDEIHYLPNWSRVLKAESDQLRRLHIPVHVVVSGSAALRVGMGARETMAGRFERLVLSHWSARDLARAFRLTKERAVELVVSLGGFPGAMPLSGDRQRWRAYVRDSIIEPAIGRDLLMLAQIRRPALLRQVFAICMGHAAEIVSLQKMAGLLADKGALATIAHYLQLLQEAFLVAPLAKFSSREVRRRGSPPKLVPLNNAFVTASASVDTETLTSDPHRRGRLIENACIAFAINSGQTVHYWRAEPLEVDAVLEGVWGKWVLEVKTGSYGARDLAGLLEFVRRFRSFRPLVICEEATVAVARRAGVSAIPWTEFLWSGVEAASSGLA